MPIAYPASFCGDLLRGDTKSFCERLVYQKNTNLIELVNSCAEEFSWIKRVSMSAGNGIPLHEKIVTVREEIVRLLKDRNLTIDQVFSRGDLLKKKRAIKYRNPENKSQVWCGRGRPPLWVRKMQVLTAGGDDWPSDHDASL